jgi:hypothetical protein
MASSADFRLAAALVAALALATPLQAEGYDHENGTRRSTWELSTSLTFYRYFEPFPRVASARACRNLCVENQRCSGWTYYDAHFQEAGTRSYKLQRVCVMGAGLKDKKSGNRPGRTSGVVHPLEEYD